jgi:hypothetical protein
MLKLLEIFISFVNWNTLREPQIGQPETNAEITFGRSAFLRHPVSVL